MQVDFTATGAKTTLTASGLDSLAVRKRRSFLRSLAGTLWKAFNGLGKALVALPPSTWMLIDVTIVSFGVYFAYGFYPPPQLPETPHIALWQGMAVFAFAVTTASLVFGLYERETILSRSRIFTRLVLTCAVAVIVAYALIYVVMYSTVSRRLTAVSLGTLFFFGGCIRTFACWAAKRVSRGLLVVGSRTLLDSFERAQTQGLLSEYRLVGYALPRESRLPAADRMYRGVISSKLEAIGDLEVTDVVVSAEAGADPEVMRWMVPCLQRGCRVTNEAVFYEKATGQILVDEITPAWFLLADLKVHCEEQATLKRIGDLIAATLALIITATLWPLIALAIKLCDGGRVIYSQVRVGQNGRLFTLYKFRTMRADAENGRSVWASPNDPRVTAVGRWLRRTRLDEIPQLWNVLKGDMSLVGPRPERPDLVEELARAIPYYSERHLVKPGVTGWAQISFRYGASIDDSKRKLQFDLYYLKHMSIELDLIILFRTLGTFLRGAC